MKKARDPGSGSAVLDSQGGRFAFPCGEWQALGHAFALMGQAVQRCPL
ncbi:hypothetical protein [Streptomyces sp. NPDC002088]